MTTTFSDHTVLYNLNCICEMCNELCMINDSHMYTIAVLIYPGVSHTAIFCLILRLVPAC